MFFLPLVLMVELNMISKSVIHAFLARTETPSTSLAAFNSAFAFYFALTSATEITAILCLSYMKSKKDLLRLILFLTVLLSPMLLLALLVAFTELGSILFGTWFGLSAQGQAEARAVVALLTLSMPVLILRGVAFALLMEHRRTPIITVSTLVRLLTLAVSLVVLPAVLSGAAIGAGALVVCMVAETVFAWIFAARYLFQLQPARSTQDSFGGYWKFSWPLVINTSAELGVIFLVNLFLGQLSRPELAIAGFGVVHGLISLLVAPMRNLTQTAQALVAHREDVRVMASFTAQLVILFGLLAVVLFHTPIREQILVVVMGLTPELAAYCEPGLQIALLMVAFWACSALFRGLLAKARSTMALALGGALRLLTVAAVSALGLSYPEVNGALLGVAAWILSYAVETCISAWRLRKIGWFVPN